jgi:hypothetical protein
VSVPPLALLQYLATLSQRADRLQQRLDAGQLGSSPVGVGHAFVDGVQQTESGTVLVLGWGFVFNEPDRAVVVIDDIELPNLPSRWPRADVAAAYATGGLVTPTAGFNALVDMAPFEPGFQSDHRHTAKIRVYAANGRAADSAPWPFVVW